MILEAVIACVDYGDFLAWTLPTNRALFDRLVVVTDPHDLRTQRLCEYWHVKCIPTMAFRGRRGDFKKGAGINVGLSDLSQEGWVVHMDADIFLPPLTRRLLEHATLDPSHIYGCDRLMVQSFEDWIRFLAMPPLQHENSAFVHTANSGFDIGVRISSNDYHGYVPIGFFQLWNPKTSGIKAYPDEHNDAGRGDMLFARNWPRSKRGFLPEVIAYHLESCARPTMGANWNGRTTPPFGPRIDVPIGTGHGGGTGYCD